MHIWVYIDVYVQERDMYVCMYVYLYMYVYTYMRGCVLVHRAPRELNCSLVIAWSVVMTIRACGTGRPGHLLLRMARAMPDQTNGAHDSVVLYVQASFSTLTSGQDFAPWIVTVI